MGKLLDELYAMLVVAVVSLLELALTVALYIAMLIGGWWLLGWLGHWLF